MFFSTENKRIQFMPFSWKISPFRKEIPVSQMPNMIIPAAGHAKFVPLDFINKTL